MTEDEFSEECGDALVCERCGSMIPNDYTEVHIEWHQKVEGAIGAAAEILLARSP